MPLALLLRKYRAVKRTLTQRLGLLGIVSFLSYTAAVQDKVALLLGGAADYLTKPFDTKELLARVAVRLREASRSDYIEAVWGIGFRLTAGS